MSVALSPGAALTGGSSEVYPRLFTAADLEVFPCDLPSGPVDYELDHGRLIIVTPPGADHGSSQVIIGAHFVAQGQLAGFGKAYTEVGVVLSRNPDTVFGADVAFVRKAKLPAKKSKEGYLETIPDLIVEIRSKNDTLAELNRKAAVYFEAGVEQVWIADRETKTITIHRSAAEPRVYHAGETLESDDPIPGFKMRIAEIFAD